jgi:copper chaperone CopZ
LIKKRIQRNSKVSTGTARRKIMKKTYKIDVDCANCANEMEEAVKNVDGVRDCVVNFMTLKMKVDYEDGVNPDEMLPILKKSIEASGSDGVIVD